MNMNEITARRILLGLSLDEACAEAKVCSVAAYAVEQEDRYPGNISDEVYEETERALNVVYDRLGAAQAALPADVLEAARLIVGLPAHYRANMLNKIRETARTCDEDRVGHRLPVAL